MFGLLLNAAHDYRVADFVLPVGEPEFAVAAVEDVDSLTDPRGVLSDDEARPGGNRAIPIEVIDAALADFALVVEAIDQGGVEALVMGVCVFRGHANLAVVRVERTVTFDVPQVAETLILAVGLERDQRAQVFESIPRSLE